MSSCLILGVSSFMGGCAAVETYKISGAVKAQDAADIFLRDGEFVVCRASSVGAVKRRYGTSIERAIAYNDFCHHASRMEDVIKGPQN